MIAGYLIAFDDDENGQADGDVLIELTEADRDRDWIELAFDDRGERMYLRFRRSDLQREIKEALEARDE